MRGTAADDMLNFEVVLANGSIVNANADENADLYKALKGGGNNFGIVTRFDMRTFSAPPNGLWGGLLFTDISQRDLVLNQLVGLVDLNEQNKADAEVVTFTYTSPGPVEIAIDLVNVNGSANSTAFAPLLTMPTILSDVTNRTYGELITEYTQAGGARYQILLSLVFSIARNARVKKMP